jgi:hypothetical protein
MEHGLGSVDIGQVWYVRLMSLRAECLGVAWISWRKDEPFGVNA